MTVKELIAKLQTLNQDLPVVVQEYDGGDDSCRPVKVAAVEQSTKLSWPTRWRKQKLERVEPPADQVVVISGLRDY